jgi:hypothetical protein
MRTIYILPIETEIWVGDTQQFYASTAITPILADGTYTADGSVYADGGVLVEEIIWSSSNLDVATINNSGLATAVGAGRTLITARGIDFRISVELVVLAKIKYLRFGGGDLVPIIGDGLYTLTDTLGNTIDALVDYEALPASNQSVTVGLEKASKCNTWVAFNLLTKKWVKIHATLANIPQASFKVIDNTGKEYFYGLLKDGVTVVLNNGSLWRGDSTQRILSDITTNAMLPTKKITDTTTLHLVKYIVESSAVTTVNFTRNDIAINTQGLETGDLNVYGRVIIDPLNTGGYFSGDDYYCKQVIENVNLQYGLKWEDNAGVISITGTIHENYKMNITTVAGDFIAAGFLKGSMVYTTDPHNPGPYQLTTLTTTLMTFAKNRNSGVEFPVGLTVTLSSPPIKVEYIPGKTGVPKLLPVTQVIRNMSYVIFICKCNYTGLTHQLKFHFESGVDSIHLKPIGWSAEFLMERVD